MTALRQRLIEDMQVRNYSPRTVEAYVAAVAKLAKYFQRSPDQLTNEDVRAFQVHLLSAKASWSQFNQIVSGLRFFFRTTLGRADVVEMLPYGKRPKRLPTVLSVEEVAQVDMLSNARITAIFQATVEATEEAIVNSLIAAETMKGVRGTACEAIPHGRVVEILRKYGRIGPV